MSLQLPPYQPIPEPGESRGLFEVSVAELHPTQWCIGMAEVWSRQNDFSHESSQERLDYLKRKPVPLVRSATGDLWMVDRHHRLRGLLGIDSEARAWGYLIADLSASEPLEVLGFLERQGWLYLFDGRGQGPRLPLELPKSLMDLDDDPYRSLVWKLKQEGAIKPQPQIPYHEFRWGAWLRRRPLPPFGSRRLEPALAPARRMVCSLAAADMPGWRGHRKACG